MLFLESDAILGELCDCQAKLGLEWQCFLCCHASVLCFFLLTSSTCNVEWRELLEIYALEALLSSEWLQFSFGGCSCASKPTEAPGNSQAPSEPKHDYNSHNFCCSECLYKIIQRLPNWALPATFKGKSGKDDGWMDFHIHTASKIWLPFLYGMCPLNEIYTEFKKIINS